MKHFTTLGLTLALSLVAFQSSAAVTKYKASLDGAQEVPAVTTTATGTATATYDDATMMFAYTVTHTIANKDVSGAHVHTGAAGTNGGVAFNLAGGGNSPSTGTEKLNANQAAELAKGNLYFNIHSDAHKSGEIRGQILLDTATTDAGASSDGGASTDGGTPPVDPMPDSGDVGVITTPADGGNNSGGGSTTETTTEDDDAADDDSSCSMGHKKSASAFSFGLLALGLASLVRSKKSKR